MIKVVGKHERSEGQRRPVERRVKVYNRHRMIMTRNRRDALRVLRLCEIWVY